MWDRQVQLEEQAQQLVVGYKSMMKSGIEGMFDADGNIAKPETEVNEEDREASGMPPDPPLTLVPWIGDRNCDAAPRAADVCRPGCGSVGALGYG